MLPAQQNCTTAKFQVKQLPRLGDHEHLYRASCSRLGLADFICRHFHSLVAEEGHIEIRTTVGTFKIFPKGPNATVRFFPLEKTSETHRLAGGDFQCIQRFARGQFRVTFTVYNPTHSLQSLDDDRWRTGPISRVIQTPKLDHPKCIRFATQAELELLDKSRGICKAVIKVFIRLVDEEPLEGTGRIARWDQIMTILRQARNTDFTHSDLDRVIPDFWKVCTVASQNENDAVRIMANVVDDFREILDSLRAEPTVRSAKIKDGLKEYIEQYGLAHICCFVTLALVSSMNCSKLLAISVASPQLWLDFLGKREFDVYVE